MAATGSLFRALLVPLLLSTVGAAFTTSPFTPQLRRPLDTVHLKPRFDVPSTSFPRQEISNGGLFGEAERSRSSKLRHRLKAGFHFFTRNKRKKLAALVFAVSVWLQPIPRQGVPAAHAAETAPTVEQVEHVEQVELIEHASSCETLVVGGSSEVEDVETLTPPVETEKKIVVNSKLAATLAGAIILPSAGVLVAGGRKSDELGEGKGQETAESEKNTAESVPSKQKRVLGLTRKGRPKDNADTYLKSLQQEKSIIKSAISKLTNQLESNEGTAVSEAGNGISNDGSDVVSPVEEEETMATNSELPLMTTYFIEARKQPKDPREEELLQKKYGAIEHIGERAFNILLDLGMIETDDEQFVVGLPELQYEQDEL